MTVKLSVLPNIERLSPRVIRILGQNPGQMTLQGTNCYLVHNPDYHHRDPQPSRLCLIDTGAAWPTSSSFLPLLRESIASLRQREAGEGDSDAITALTDIVLTHRHADHIGGLKPILDIFNALGLPQPRVHKYRHPIERDSEGGSVDWDQLLIDEIWPKSQDSANLHWLQNDSRISLRDTDVGSDGTTLRILHTPGHTPDSISLSLEETGELFTADTVLGQGTSIFADLSAYMSSLQKLRDLQPNCIYPGHGPHIDGQGSATAKIKEYIDHRLERERQIVEVLSQLTTSASQSGVTARQIVEVLYAGLGIAVYVAAEKPVSAHLRKLEMDGQVVRDGSGKWKLL